MSSRKHLLFFLASILVLLCVSCKIDIFGVNTPESVSITYENGSYTSGNVINRYKERTVTGFPFYSHGIILRVGLITHMKDSFSNIVTYAKQNLKTFQEEPFCEVDSLLLCELSYLNIHGEYANSIDPKGMPIRDLLKAEYYGEMFARIWAPDEAKELLYAVVANPRFRDIRIRYYRNEVNPKANLQFSAVVFSLSETLHYVAFRGTDWSIVGWKEDFLLALPNPVVAQKMAESYLENVAEELKGMFIVGGHSKGGNLAVYAASCCKKKVQERIESIFSHDGPGFEKPFLEKKGFQRIQGRIHKTVPFFSLFGQIFEQEVPNKTVESNGVAVMQHLPFTWKVDGNQFAEMKEQSKVSSSAIQNLNQWLSSMDYQERDNFIHTVFKLVDDLGVKTIDDFTKNVPETISSSLKAINNLPIEQRKYLLSALRFAVFGIKTGSMQNQALSLWNDAELDELTEEYPDA